MVNIYRKLDNQVQQRQRNLQIRRKDDLNAFATTCQAYNAQTQDRLLSLNHPGYTEDYAGLLRPSKPHTKYELDIKALSSAYARRLVCFPHTGAYTQAAGPCTIVAHRNMFRVGAKFEILGLREYERSSPSTGTCQCVRRGHPCL